MEHTTTRKKRKLAPPAPPYITEKTRWAYLMQSQDLPDAATIGAFPGHHPNWLIRTGSGVKVDGKVFALMRRDVLRLTIEQCAKVLRVSQARIKRWESGASNVPYTAFEVLRLISESPHFKLAHQQWDGWFINDSGALVSPDYGRLAFTAHELNSIPRLHQDVSVHQNEAERQRKRADELQAENTRLRELFLSQGVTDELHAMQDRLVDLLSRISTARVLKLKPAKPQKLKEAVAS